MPTITDSDIAIAKSVARTIAVLPEDQTALHFINAFVMQAENSRLQYEEQWEENWRNYRVEPYFRHGYSYDAGKSNPYGWKNARSIQHSVNELKTPESHQIGNTLRSVLLASLFGVRDYVQADPVGHEDYRAARKVSKLVMYGTERPGNYRTNYETLGDAVIFGTGVYRAHWVSQTRTVPRRLPVMGPNGPTLDPDTGLPLTVLQNVEVPVTDDVRLSPMNLWRTWFDPSATRLDEADGYVEQFTISRDSLDELRGSPAWSSEGIARALATKPTGRQMMSKRDEPKLLTELLTLEDIQHAAAFGYYGGFRYTGMLPSEVARTLGLDPKASNTISIINGQLVQKTQNPQRSGLLDCATLTILPTGASLYGLSPLSVIKYLQDVSDTQLILTVQAMIEAVYQNYVMGGGSGAGPEFERRLMMRKPREVFTIPGDVTQIAPLQRDYTGLSIAAQSLSMLSQMMRDASSARDPVQGVLAKGDTTATEVSTVAASALQNVDSLAALIERDELPRQGRLIFDLYYIHLEDEGRVIKRTGDDEAQSISFFDIDADYDLNYVGARQALGRPQKANQFRDFVQLMLSNSLTAASLDINELVRRYADEAVDIKGLEQMVIKDPDEIVARLQAAGLSGPLQTPPSRQGGVTPSQNAGEPNAA